MTGITKGIVITLSVLTVVGTTFILLNQPESVPPVMRTDVTIVGGLQKPSAVIDLQPGTPHYVVFKGRDLTLNPSVPIMVQAVTVDQEAMSPAILIHPQPERQRMVKSREAFGYSLEYAKIWLPDGAQTGTVWIRP